MHLKWKLFQQINCEIACKIKSNQFEQNINQRFSSLFSITNIKNSHYHLLKWQINVNSYGQKNTSNDFFQMILIICSHNRRVNVVVVKFFIVIQSVIRWCVLCWPRLTAILKFRCCWRGKKSKIYSNSV